MRAIDDSGEASATAEQAVTIAAGRPGGSGSGTSGSRDTTAPRATLVKLTRPQAQLPQLGEGERDGDAARPRQDHRTGSAKAKSGAISIRLRLTSAGRSMLAARAQAQGDAHAHPARRRRQRAKAHAQADGAAPVAVRGCVFGTARASFVTPSGARGAERRSYPLQRGEDRRSAPPTPAEWRRPRSPPQRGESVQQAPAASVGACSPRRPSALTAPGGATCRGACSRRSTCTAATASRSTDPDHIRRFVPALIDAIGMRAHGPSLLERFGDGELEGWSAMQFIETSSITVHADELRRPLLRRRLLVPALRRRASRPPSPSRTSAARRRVRVLRAMTELAPVLGVLAGRRRRRGHDPLRARHPARRDAPAPRDVADLGRARDRRVPVPARRRRLVEPRHGRRPGRPHGPHLRARDPHGGGRR